MPTNSLYIRDKTRPPRGWRPNVLPQRGDKRFWPNSSPEYRQIMVPLLVSCVDCGMCAGAGQRRDEGGHKMPTNSLYIRDKTAQRFAAATPEGAPPDEGGHKMPTNSLYIRDKTRPPRGCTAQRFATARDKRFWPNTSWPSSWRVRRTPPPPRLSIGKSWCCVLAQVRGEMRVSTKCQQILYTFVTKRGHPEGGGPTFCHSEGINVFGRTPPPPCAESNREEALS